MLTLKLVDKEKMLTAKVSSDQDSFDGAGVFKPGDGLVVHHNYPLLYSDSLLRNVAGWLRGLIGSICHGSIVRFKYRAIPVVPALADTHGAPHSSSRRIAGRTGCIKFCLPPPQP